MSHTKILAMLFSDLKDYSKIESDSLKEQIEIINQDMISKYLNPYNHIFVNTWGDGFFICSYSCSDITEIALRMRDHIRTLNWRKLHFINPLSIRIALHSSEATVIEKDGIEDALDWYQEAKKKYADFYPLSEIPLNSLGYQLLGQDKIDEAIEIFKLATIDFPDSWNTYDSYAEALMRDGQTDAAIENYKKSLELNPNTNNAREMLKRMEKK